MGKQRKTRQFAAVKRIINPKDARTDQKEAEAKKKAAEDKKKQDAITHAPVPSSAMFFKYNTALGPPYHILVDTNFINFSIQNKLDLIDSMMDCLLAKCTPVITDCVMSELEKLGPKFRVALKMAKNPR
jgi:U3 small nucleolar RNA-associated protein 24